MTLQADSPATGARIPLSHTQNFLRIFDQGDAAGPFGGRYNIVVGWRVGGPLDPAVLRDALTDVVARHDTLRATIVREGDGHQTFADPSPAGLTVVSLDGTPGEDRARVAEEFCGDIEAGTYDSATIPHLRVFYGRFDATDGVIVLVVHHTAGDGWSMQLLMRDIAALYALRSGFPADLPDAASYAEYVRWQIDGEDAELTEMSQEYWREKLAGARMLTVPTDHLRSAELPRSSPVHRFALSRETTAATMALAEATRSSAFMVALTAYKVALAGLLDATDIAIPTLTSGRTEPRFDNTVGPFFNFVPLRTDLSGVTTFREALARVRTTCLDAYSNELPFARVVSEAPELMGPMAEDDKAACAFQAWQFSEALYGTKVGDLTYAEIRERLLPQADGTDIPDGALLTLDMDPAGRIFGNIAYNANLYTAETAERLASAFAAALTAGVADPDAPLT
ncbi:condensation domain-containing protein [Actinocorallia sp. A-T 12471]|uniref:condensation domain-containing protein n=1 Tax=Actinocorallia sp. A-T 12471 TaxID=3089813 RepID=UPI0029D0004D|nr:condensation domain-containing protein [Actinocorallia sp. A-T 12471]MDX6741622.1 condensation domain-containing protein [Actinocorallia sp. A-T 12471]